MQIYNIILNNLVCHFEFRKIKPTSKTLARTVKFLYNAHGYKGCNVSGVILKMVLNIFAQKIFL